MSGERFHRRLSDLYTQWKESKGSFAEASCLAVITGKIDNDEDIGYLKSYALFTYLFGDELQNTLLLAREDSVTIVCDSRDAASLLKLVNKKTEKAPTHPAVTIVPYKPGTITEAFSDVKGGVIGLLPKEEHHGKNVDELKDAVKKKGLKEGNIAEGLSFVMKVKDDHELKLIKYAAGLTCAVFKHYLVPQIETIFDEDRKITHQKLSEKVEACIVEPKRVKADGLDAQLCDPCYPPIIQSGGVYDLRPSAQSTEKKLKAGCVLASLGARYSNYCSNATRTYLIDCSDEQEKLYEALLGAMNAALSALKPGNKLSAVYQAVQKSVEATKPGLSKHMMKNVGFGIGIEYRDAAFVLNAKNDRLLAPGMIFNLSVGLQNLNDSEKGDYALMVADTVVVPKGDAAPEVLTQSCKKAFKSVSYKLQDEDEEEEVKPEEVELDESLLNGARRSRHAKSASEMAETQEEMMRRKKHQEEIAKKMLEEGRARLAKGNLTEKKEATRDKMMDEYLAYKASSKYPTAMKPRQLYVDMDAESVFVPINGVPIPFHISTIKNVRMEEGDNNYLRINFHFPPSTTSNLKSKSDAPKFPDLLRDFVKEVTFRSTNSHNLQDSMRKIRELRRKFTTQLQEQQEPETVVQQDTLVLDRSSTRNPYLTDVSIRPQIQAGKANKGMLEAHTNGFRFRNSKGAHVDIIYSNVKHAFFQEAKNEVIVLLHFSLKNPILIKGKKTTDVQFYLEVMESAVKLNESRRKAYDQDELVEEQREREKRNRINNFFLKFTKDVEEKHGLEFDAPYRDLGFHGAPKNASVFLMPTVSCIVSLVEWPPFILTLQDVEIAYLERVSFSLRNFDMVFVFKNFTEEAAKAASWTRISSIPTQELDPLKKFLDEQEIKYYEGSKNLVWDNILASIRETYSDFLEAGGWSFLDNEQADDEEDEDELDEGDEAFEPAPSSAGEESEGESEDYEDSDDDAAEELGGDSDEGEEELSSDEEGMDWDELERKAAKEDMDKHAAGSDDDDRRGSKKGARPSGNKRRR